MADINVLIDQNLEKMQALAQEADEALNHVNQLEQSVAILVGTVTGKEQEVLTGFEMLGSQLTELEQKLATELQTAKEDFIELRQKAESVEGQLDQL